MRRECDISIITINYNGLKDTCELIDCLLCEDGRSMECGDCLSFEIIVVDNGSACHEAETIAGRYPTVRVIANKANLGFAEANNIGMREACGRYLILLNNDTVVNILELKALADRLEAKNNIGAVCPKIRFYPQQENTEPERNTDCSPLKGSAPGHGEIQFAGFTPFSKITLRNRGIGYGEADQGQYDQAHPTPYLHGAAMMVKREAVERAGMMPTCYFLYYEETEWSVTLRRAGYELWYEPRCTVFHKESRTTGRQSPLKTYYTTRNRMLFAWRNLPPLERMLSILYQTLAVVTRDCLRHLLHRRTDLAKASLQGAYDFLVKHSTGPQQ